ncbi:hypothetical protein BB561_006194, partial [Smittium simulii]
MVQPVRLYSKGRFLGYQRSKKNQVQSASLVQIEGVNTTKDTSFYMGKRVAYVYKAKREINGSKIRVVWGRISRPHGNSGVVRVRFRKNLPPRAMEQQKKQTSAAQTTKKAPRQTKLSRDQIDRVVKGGPPVEPNKYKLLYFDGFKRNRVTWVKQVLANSSINTRAVANIAWIGESTIELCVNSKNVLKLSNAICKITGVTKNTTFCPADTLEQQAQLKHRLKWLMSSDNKN